MNTWILISVAILIIISEVIYKYRNRFDKIKFRNLFVLGISIPLLYAVFWGSSLLDLFPKLTFIDLATGFLLGVISGFFIALTIVNRKV